MNVVLYYQRDTKNTGHDKGKGKDRVFVNAVQRHFVRYCIHFGMERATPSVLQPKVCLNPIRANVAIRDNEHVAQAPATTLIPFGNAESNPRSVIPYGTAGVFSNPC